MKTLLITSFLMAQVNVAFAGVLRFVGEPLKTVSESDVNVPIYKEAFIEVDNSHYKVYLTGEGIRTKTIFRAKVYIATSYIDDPKGLQSENALEKITHSQAKALQLTFLRNVDAEKIRESFKESLQKNGADPNSVPIQKVLSKLTFDMKPGSTLTLVSYPKKGSKNESLVFEVANNRISSEGKDLASDFWKIWFGTPADGGLEALKKSLVGEKS